MKRFALIGAAGYIAPRHMKAIAETGSQLVVAYDPSDNVGVIDNYFPCASFFVEYERFQRFIDREQYSNEQAIDYTSVCSPNYLHDPHIRGALRQGTDVICEKPLVLNPYNIDALQRIEELTGKRVFTILQLRLHHAIQELKEKIINEAPATPKHEVDLTYITSRGRWYYSSWKGTVEKSGGIATNIGVHFFDMLYWLFGDLQHSVVHLYTHDRAAGYLEYERARVRWFLSINYETLPESVKTAGQRTFRSVVMDGSEVEFSSGFTDLHTQSYQKILAGEGFGLNEARHAVEITNRMRREKPSGLRGEYHPMASLPLTDHPFVVK